MKIRMFAMLALVAMFCSLGATAQVSQWANTQVTLVSALAGNSANFTLNTHNIGQDICVDFTLDPTSYNVAGDVAGRRTIPAGTGSQDIYVGRYTQQNTSQKWYVYVTFHYTSGACN
jgi:hypothetical protein